MACILGQQCSRTTGLAVALLLILPLPIGMGYAARLWQEKLSSGQVSFSAREMSGAQVLATWALVLYVALLICSDTLASYTAQANDGHYPWEPIIVVLLVEAAKLIASICLFAGGTMVAAAATTAPTWSILAEAAVRLCPVAIIYAGNNCLVFFLLAKVQLDAFVVWRNTTILFTALLWTFVLGRSLNTNQWMAVSFLFAGCCLNSLDTDGSVRDTIGYPVLFMLASAFFSSLAAALNEKTLKQERFRHDIGIDRLNCILYAETSLFLIICICAQAVLAQRHVADEFPRLFAGLNSSALAIIIMQSALGISVSRVLLHANAVAKTMANGMREILLACAAPFFVTSRLDWISFPSVLWIATAMLTFFVPSSSEKVEETKTEEKLSSQGSSRATSTTTYRSSTTEDTAY